KAGRVAEENTEVSALLLRGVESSDGMPEETAESDDGMSVKAAEPDGGMSEKDTEADGEIPQKAEKLDEEMKKRTEESGSKVSGDTTDSSAEGKKRKKKLHIILPVVAAAAAAVYLGIGVFYTGHYLPNTTINGIDCSSETVDELERMIVEEVNGYELVLEERGGSAETIRGADIGLQVVFDGTLDEILEEQKAFAWPAVFWKSSTYEPGNTVIYDADLLADVLAALGCMDAEQMTVTADAQIVFAESETFEIEPEVYGTYMEMDTLSAAVDTAICSLTESLNLEDTDCYENPVYTEESRELIDACEQMNTLLAVNITYDMLDIGTIEISKGEMSGWITLGEDFSVSVNEEAVAAFVADFAEQYDTQYTEHTLKTTWGSTVTISKGSYGWKLDQEAETEALLAELAAGEDVVREPNYSHTAASHGENDYGDTYVEINLTAQHLYFYKDGALIVESDFVPGNVAKGMSTPTGIYPVTYTQRNATLRGDGYATPVSYWMPFNGGVGMHDATWRSRFGGTIYKTSGSHGCINLPLSAAKKIYENLSKGDPVLVYTLSGTESSSKTTGTSTGSGSNTNSSEADEVADTDSGADADTDSGADTDADSDADTGTGSDADVNIDSDAATDTDSDADTATGSGSDSGSQADAQESNRTDTAADAGIS
ncbi:MAG: L,D-transpeptidase family protein, partial [Lachnospiraceae bacterium]|nr:L,D-transpeptidase family protein [Lachnospiraceae bacterium]